MATTQVIGTIYTIPTYSDHVTEGTTSTTEVLLKAAKAATLPYSGVVMIVFELRSTSSGSYVYASLRLYRNGTETTIANVSTASDVFTRYVYGTTIQEGDEIRLYAWSGSGVPQAQVRGLMIIPRNDGSPVWEVVA